MMDLHEKVDKVVKAKRELTDAVSKHMTALEARDRAEKAYEKAEKELEQATRARIAQREQDFTKTHGEVG
jgi:hypothetical protein